MYMQDFMHNLCHGGEDPIPGVLIAGRFLLSNILNMDHGEWG